MSSPLITVKIPIKIPIKTPIKPPIKPPKIIKATKVPKTKVVKVSKASSMGTKLVNSAWPTWICIQPIQGPLLPMR